MYINDKDKIKGIVATIIFHGILIVTLTSVCLYYSYPPEEDELMEPKEEEILFGGEYVMLGEVVQMEPAGTTSGEVLPSEGDVPLPEITQGAESPMKVEVVEQTPEPTAEELAAEAERVRREKETADKIKKRVSFGNTGNNSGGVTEVPATDAVMRASSGMPGVTGLEGYTLDSWAQAKSTLEGIIKIRVRVNARGKVVEARYDSGSGAAASSLEVRKNCEEAAKKCQFSVPENRTTEGVGYITYNFTQKSN